MTPRRTLLLLLPPVLLLLFDLLPGSSAGLRAARVVVGLPVVLLLPGHLALTGLNRRRSGAPGLADAVTVSVGLLVVSGLLMDLIGIPLGRVEWATVVALLCLAASVPLLVRRDVDPDDGRSARRSVYSVLIALELAVVFGLAAWATVTTAERAEDATPVLELSLNRTGPAAARLRVTTSQAEPVQRYAMDVAMGGGRPSRYRVEVRAGAPWTLDVPLGATRNTLTARLTVAGGRLVREVHLSAGTAP